MLATVAIILIILWVLGSIVLKTIGAAIHVALAIGVILLVLHFVRGRRAG